MINIWEQGVLWLNENVLSQLVELCLVQFQTLFNQSLNVLQTEAAKTPVQFSASIVATLKTISNTVILPVAGLILTYIFCYELITLLTEKNNMSEFDVSALFKVFLKTTLAILLVTNCFNITLAFFDIGQYFVNNMAVATVGNVPIQPIIDALVESAGTSFVTGILYGLLSIVVWGAGFVAVGLIYLIAWSRIVYILIYISVAPLPFATLMNRDWIGAIGQNYIKNLMALALQGFLMMICIVIYAGIVTTIQPIIVAEGGVMGLLMLLVMMFICVKSLMSCLTLAKSIMGAH